MNFKSTEEIEEWFKNNKYDQEVHNAIEFLINQIDKICEEFDDYQRSERM